MPRIYWQTLGIGLVAPSTPPPATPASGPAPLHHFATLNSILIMTIYRVVQQRKASGPGGPRKSSKKTQKAGSEETSQQEPKSAVCSSSSRDGLWGTSASWRERIKERRRHDHRLANNYKDASSSGQRRSLYTTSLPLCSNSVVYRCPINYEFASEKELKAPTFKNPICSVHDDEMIHARIVSRRVSAHVLDSRPSLRLCHAAF